MNTATAAFVPALFTVLQAAWVLNICRTTAYAMTKEWRATDGKSGMKVVEVGSQLRVPRAWLEEWIGAQIDYVPDHSELSRRARLEHRCSNCGSGIRTRR